MDLQYKMTLKIHFGFAYFNCQNQLLKILSFFLGIIDVNSKPIFRFPVRRDNLVFVSGIQKLTIFSFGDYKTLTKLKQKVLHQTMVYVQCKMQNATYIRWLNVSGKHTCGKTLCGSWKIFLFQFSSIHTNCICIIT